MGKITAGGAPVSASLSADVIQAITILQKYCLAATNTVTMEQYEHGLDELIRHPHRIGNPQKMVLSALKNGRKFTYDRLRIAPVTSYQEELDERADSYAEEYQLTCDIGSLIDRSEVEPRDQKILRSLLAGYEAEDIAKAAHVPLARAQVWISRARKRASKLWFAILSDNEQHPFRKPSSAVE